MPLSNTGRLAGAGVHPAIRIICLILFGSVLSLMGSAALLPAMAVLSVLFILTSPHYLRSSLVMLRRLRFLLLSLAIVYLWFTPGTPVYAGLGIFSPSIEGLHLGLVRIAILVMIVMAVHILLRTSSREELLGAILWLAGPLSLVGISHERLAVRLTLVLQVMDRLLNETAGAPVQRDEAGGKLDYLARRFSFRYQQILARAEQEPLEAIAVDAALAPPLAHWLYPLALVFVLTAMPRAWQWLSRAGDFLPG